jgi:hypothetical protein
VNIEILQHDLLYFVLDKTLLTAEFYLKEEGVFRMTLQEAYRKEINKRANLKSIMSYYADDSLTPEQRLEKAH